MLSVSPPPTVSSVVVHTLCGVIDEYFAMLMQAPEEVPLVYNHGNYSTCMHQTVGR